MPDDRTARALSEAGLVDMRPAYRDLLRRLKQKSEAEFEAASARYGEVVEPALSDPGADPLAAWLAYGTWLVGRLGPGRVVRIDPTGMAHPAGDRPRPGEALLFLPDAASEGAVPLARPSDPSAPLAAALELLVR